MESARRGDRRRFRVATAAVVAAGASDHPGGRSVLRPPRRVRGGGGALGTGHATDGARGDGSARPGDGPGRVLRRDGALGFLLQPRFVPAHEQGGAAQRRRRNRRAAEGAERAAA